jgi:DNA-binding response OmpR family regulator
VHGGRLDPGVELLVKPFTQTSLAAKIRDILDAKRVPGRILLVEDELLVQVLAVEYLEEAGFTVDAAASATEAMNKFNLVPGGFDAVIVDLGLPDRTGDSLVRELRSVNPAVAVVLATGQAGDAVRDAFQDQQKLACVAKPYSAKQLIGALNGLGVGRR